MGAVYSLSQALFVAVWFAGTDTMTKVAFTNAFITGGNENVFAIIILWASVCVGWMQLSEKMGKRLRCDNLPFRFDELCTQILVTALSLAAMFAKRSWLRKLFVFPVYLFSICGSICPIIFVVVNWECMVFFKKDSLVRIHWQPLYLTVLSLISFFMASSLANPEMLPKFDDKMSFDDYMTPALIGLTLMDFVEDFKEEKLMAEHNIESSWSFSGYFEKIYSDMKQEQSGNDKDRNEQDNKNKVHSTFERLMWGLAVAVIAALATGVLRVGHPPDVKKSVVQPIVRRKG
jgi:hypothetical protein